MNEFRQITLVGVGLMGGSLGLALKRKGFAGEIVGVSRQQTLDTAKQMGAIDWGVEYHDLYRAVENADAVVLCTPIRRIEELIGQIGIIGGKLKKDCIISDVGSTKSHLCQVAAQKLPEHLPFIGGHPMTGSEQSRIEAADPFLFENSIYVLTPGSRVPASLGHHFGSLLQRTGAKVILMDPKTHDRIAAVISHVPQLLAVALMNWASRHNKEEGATLQLAAGGFRDMTRIASSSYDMWRDIIDTNQMEIEKRIDEFIEELRIIKLDLQTGKLGDRFGSARAARHTIPKDTKGFLGPLHEILVVASDQPGVIARISTVLADAGLNIKDIEVLKVREGEGGTLRVALESREAAQRAVRLLRDANVEARLRE